jgi:hypothetical protein
MPRNSLTEQQKEYIKQHANLGGNALAEILKADRAAIYQFATNEGFSVKKNGKLTEYEKRLKGLKKMQSAWPKQYRRYKKFIVTRDGLYCHYCNKLMTYNEAQVDHVIAKARGGSDAPNNLVLACSRCNMMKGTTCYSCPEFRNAIECEQVS